jgi:hypothetical protein
VAGTSAAKRRPADLGGINDPEPSRIVNGPPIVDTNAMTQLFDPNGLRPLVRNFDQVAAVLIGHLRRAARDDPSVLATLHRVESMGLVPKAPPASADDRLPLVIPLQLAVRGQDLALSRAPPWARPASALFTGREIGIRHDLLRTEHPNSVPHQSREVATVLGDYRPGTH